MCGLHVCVCAAYAPRGDLTRLPLLQTIPTPGQMSGGSESARWTSEAPGSTAGQNRGTVGASVSVPLLSLLFGLMLLMLVEAAGMYWRCIDFSFCCTTTAHLKSVLNPKTCVCRCVGCIAWNVGARSPGFQVMQAQRGSLFAQCSLVKG